MKMPTIVGSFIFISRDNFILSWVEHAKMFYNLGTRNILGHFAIEGNICWHKVVSLVFQTYRKMVANLDGSICSPREHILFFTSIHKWKKNKKKKTPPHPQKTKQKKKKQKKKKKKKKKKKRDNHSTSEFFPLYVCIHSDHDIRCLSIEPQNNADS